MIIYKITNRVNGKVYIGQTIQRLKDRWYGHCSKNSECPELKAAIAKYGKENFTVEQIDVASDRDELDKKEQYWIAHYGSMNRERGYNLTSGGEHPEVTDEFRAKCSERHIGEKCYWWGKKLSEEHRRRIGEGGRGKFVSEETRTKQSEAQKGKKFSEEHKRKIGDARRGCRMREESKRILSEKAKLRSHSPETRAKMSEMRSRGKSPRARKVLCVETGEIFLCGKDASEFKCVNYSRLLECCKGKCNTTGGYHWRYVDGE